MPEGASRRRGAHTYKNSGAAVYPKTCACSPTAETARPWPQKPSGDGKGGATSSEAVGDKNDPKNPWTKSSLSPPDSLKYSKKQGEDVIKLHFRGKFGRALCKLSVRTGRKEISPPSCFVWVFSSSQLLNAKVIFLSPFPLPRNGGVRIAIGL